MADAQKARDEMEPHKRLDLISGRISMLENNLYNQHLNELEGQVPNAAEVDRLTKALETLKAERDKVNAEIESKGLTRAAP
jgi:hypothetical protein